MTEENQKMWIEGRKSAYRDIYRQCLREISCKDLDSMVLERGEVIGMLRTWCAEYGDNDWDDDLCLVDIIEKHLLNYLIK